jgi:predicted ATPase/class 3 adenylate cyclase/Tfp pilus assembly protein PilF
MQLPAGTVAFLFTDIEGSTRRWETDAPAMAAALAQHNQLLRAAITAHGGVAFKTVGDAFQAAFGRTPDAVAAAVSAQQSLAEADWGMVGPLAVRMAIHVGAAEPDERGDYTAPALNRLARLLAAGYGGQVLLTAAAAQLARDSLPPGVTLRDLGQHRLRDLLAPEAVSQLVLPGLRSDFPPLKTLAASTHNLPVTPTPLVGRVAELADLLAWLSDSATHLVTLTGPGGVGKTRLALQAAAEALDSFPDGVFLVQLGQVAEARLVLSTISSALGVRPTGGQSVGDALAAWLGPRQLLLVLDNFEQVLAAAPDVAALLAACPGLSVLATSRAALHLRGEQELPLSPLGLPANDGADPVSAAESDAVRLFVQRAQAVRPDFRLSEKNAAAIVGVCNRLDGLPLAIELAAARVRLFSPRALLERLAAEDGPLGLLTGGARDLPLRQQALRATIAWSHELLGPSEQAVFRRLAVFVGGCTLEAAEAVCRVGAGADGTEPDVLSDVAALVDINLLRLEETVGEPRLRMLQTLRVFGLERLHASGEEAAVRRAHAAEYLGLAETARPQLVGPDQEEWLNRLEADHDNLRAALEWAAAAQDADTGLRLAGALWRFWYVRGYLAEGRARLATALAVGDTAEQTEVRARALNGAGVLAIYQGDLAGARPTLEASLVAFRALGNEDGEIRVLNNLGIVYTELADYDAARQLLEEGLVIARRTGDPSRVAGVLHSLAVAYARQGDFETARDLFGEALVLQRAGQDKEASAATLLNLGDVIRRQGELAAARDLMLEALALATEIGDYGTTAVAEQGLGTIALAEDRPREAWRRMRTALALHAGSGDAAALENVVEAVAELAAAADEPLTAARLLGAAATLRSRTGEPIPPGDRPPHDQATNAARAALGDAAFDAAWAIGAAFSTADLLAEVARASDAAGSGNG